MAARRRIRLSDAVRATGWKFVKCDRPGKHPDRLGKPSPHQAAVALSGGRVACKHDSWSCAYSVSHEIVESMHKFRHSQQLFCDQANLLNEWHTLRSGLKPQFLSCFAPS